MIIKFLILFDTSFCNEISPFTINSSDFWTITFLLVLCNMIFCNEVYIYFTNMFLELHSIFNVFFENKIFQRSSFKVTHRNNIICIIFLKT